MRNEQKRKRIILAKQIFHLFRFKANILIWLSGACLQEELADLTLLMRLSSGGMVDLTLLMRLSSG